MISRASGLIKSICSRITVTSAGATKSIVQGKVRDAQCRWIGTFPSSPVTNGNTESTDKPDEVENGGPLSYSYTVDANMEQHPEVNGRSSTQYKTLSSLKASKRHDMVMVYTCKVCETRSVRTACRESYDKGIVVVKCAGCNNLHLIADRFGWFGEPGSVEDFLAARGETVKKGNSDTMNLTLEDLAGKKKLKNRWNCTVMNQTPDVGKSPTDSVATIAVICPMPLVKKPCSIPYG